MNHATWSRLRGEAFVAVFVTQTREKTRNLVILKFARLRFEYYFEASGLRAIVSQSISIPYSRGDKSCYAAMVQRAGVLTAAAEGAAWSGATTGITRSRSPWWIVSRNAGHGFPDRRTITMPVE